MNEVFRLAEIKEAVRRFDAVSLMEEAFSAWSSGLCVIPPVGELIFDEACGETHIKYGYIKGEEDYVVKIASGFYNNSSIGIPSSQGVVLLFSALTGELRAVMLDEGVLTNERTAAAGAVAAKYMAPREVRGIGIVGAGIQAKLQLKYLENVVDCRKVYLWSHDVTETYGFVEDFRDSSYEIEVVSSTEELCNRSGLIVTATPSQSPLIMSEYVKPGTHITAVGSDTAEKIELEPELLEKAGCVAVDSIEQSRSRGEVFRATAAGINLKETLCEIGDLINGRIVPRKTEDSITVADLTGIAVQDLKIARGVWDELKGGKR